MKTTKTIQSVGVLLLWLAGLGLASAQTNSIEGFDVTQEGGKVVVRITMKEPLQAPPPNFNGQVGFGAPPQFGFPQQQGAPHLAGPPGAPAPQSQIETALSLPRPDPAALWLAHVLEESGFLFVRYVRAGETS